MTLEQFDKTAFSKGMKVLVDGKEHEISAVDFHAGEIEVVSSNTKAWIQVCDFDIEIVNSEPKCSNEAMCAYKIDGACSLSIGNCEFKI